MPILKAKTYRCYLVRCYSNFNPKDWRSTPKFYTIVKEVGTTHRLGRVDSWRFRQNKKSLTSGKNLWAIYITQ